MMQIQFRTIGSLTQPEQERIWAIYKTSYTVEREVFLDKQQRLDLYAMYYNPKKELVGFTGIRKNSCTTSSRKYIAIYLGQTIILPQYRGKKLIQKTVMRIMLHLKFKNPFHKIVIWNDSLSYRPYLVMAKGLKDFYPNPNKAEQKEFEAIRDELGMKYYPESYDKQTGIVSKAHRVLLADEITLTEKDLQNEYIQFFVKKNPGYIEGNGLITFSPATFGNLFYYLVGRKFKRARK
ncbi:hypothetical protein [Flavobacterium sp. NRK F7]|uniref:hypothetical protein n=1 Tax=Flavobacterium sp. NRK F7 TaxID=2954930 RepID=UPI0020907F78|nr:hypothetical protein [Flavobacterium sp. NRK F7]MCO6162660.1 hypothetical protein [Flavobacterium sp. NRK F7]